MHLPVKFEGNAYEMHKYLMQMNVIIAELMQIACNFRKFPLNHGILKNTGTCI